MRQSQASITIPPIGRRSVALWFLIATLAGLAGPFGTFRFAFGLRLVFWAALVVGAALIGRLCLWCVARLFRGRDLRPWSDLLMVGLMTLIYAPLVWALTEGLLLRGSPERAQFWAIAAYVLALSAGGLAILRLAAVLRPAEPQPPRPPRLQRRLPEGFRGPILRLTVRDHFVDVVSAEDSHRIRLRFGDAIAEMDTVEGFCTHRSHWVARQAVSGVRREGGRTFLQLSNGDEVPVSRKYRPQLEAAGLL